MELKDYNQTKERELSVVYFDISYTLSFIPEIDVEQHHSDF